MLDAQTQHAGSMALPSLSPGVSGRMAEGGGVPALLREADGSFHLVPREPGAQACWLPVVQPRPPRLHTPLRRRAHAVFPVRPLSSAPRSRAWAGLLVGPCVSQHTARAI